MLLCSAGVAACARTPGPVLVDHSWNHRALTVRPGRIVIVQLDRTTWTFHPPGGDVLRQSAQLVRDGPLSCQVLADCGTVTVVVRAARPGDAVITASRRKCGELIMCDARAGTFRIRVHVRG